MKKPVVSTTLVMLGGVALILIGTSLLAQTIGAGSAVDVTAQAPTQWKLVWSDEFEKEGPPNPRNWRFERGFVRNDELQWYQPDNARCENGLLVIEARRQRLKNTDHREGHHDWRRNRQYAEYTSASLKTRRLHHWKYGRFEMRGRIDTRTGLWPTFWTLGTAREWPGCGEIDILEYYRGTLLANACWASATRWQPVWDAVKIPIRELGGQPWTAQFHTWRMDWDEAAIKIYVDDRLLNTIILTKTINNDSEQANPFHEPHYLLLSLAIGGTNGGDPSATDFPARFEVDYVRVFQKSVEN